MRKSAIFLITIATIFFITACGDTQAEKAPLLEAPDFEIEDINGKAIKLSDYRGDVIILNLFGTWCPPCRREMPDFNQIWEEYPKGVTIIAVSVGNESTEKVQEFAGANKLQFIVAVDDGSVSDLYGPIRAIPVSVIIDRDFRIARKYIGRRTKEQFTDDIEKLLQ